MKGVPQEGRRRFRMTVLCPPSRTRNPGREHKLEKPKNVTGLANSPRWLATVARATGAAGIAPAAADCKWRRRGLRGASSRK